MSTLDLGDREDVEAYEAAKERRSERWEANLRGLRTVAIALGLILAGAWYAQDEPHRESLSINLHGEQALAVVGLALLVFGVGVAVGLSRATEPRKRDGKWR